MNGTRTIALLVLALVAILPAQVAGEGSKGPTEEQYGSAFTLVTLGYDLGTTGPASDGVDGDWGPASVKALKDAQSVLGVPVTGRRDRKTYDAIQDFLNLT